MDCGMDLDGGAEEAFAPVYQLAVARPLLLHGRYSGGNGKGEGREDGRGAREGCGRVVCRACCVEDVCAGTLGCLDCLS